MVSKKKSMNILSGVESLVMWMSLSYPTGTPCKPVNYRCSRLTVLLCAACVINVIFVTVSVTMRINVFV